MASEKADLPQDNDSLPPNYASSEAFTDSPPPAYLRKTNTVRLQITRVVCFTVLAAGLLTGIFILAHSWIQTRNACDCGVAPNLPLRGAGFLPRSESLIDESHQQEMVDNMLESSRLDQESRQMDIPLPDEEDSVEENDEDEQEEDSDRLEMVQEAMEEEQDGLQSLVEEEPEKKVKLPIDLILGNPALAGRDVQCKVEKKLQNLGGGILSKTIIVTCDDDDKDSEGPVSSPFEALLGSRPAPSPPMSLLAPILKMMAARANARLQRQMQPKPSFRRFPQPFLQPVGMPMNGPFLQPYPVPYPGGPFEGPGPMSPQMMDSMHGPMNQEPMNQGPMNQGPMSQGPMNQGFMSQEPMNHGPMNQGHMNHGPMDQGPMNHGPMDQGHMNHGPMDQGHMNHGPMDQGPMEHGRIEQGPMNQGPMFSGPMPSAGNSVMHPHMGPAQFFQQEPDYPQHSEEPNMPFHFDHEPPMPFENREREIHEIHQDAPFREDFNREVEEEEQERPFMPEPIFRPFPPQEREPQQVPEMNGQPIKVVHGFPPQIPDAIKQIVSHIMRKSNNNENSEKVPVIAIKAFNPEMRSIEGPPKSKLLLPFPFRAVKVHQTRGGRQLNFDEERDEGRNGAPFPLPRGAMLVGNMKPHVVPEAAGRALDSSPVTLPSLQELPAMRFFPGRLLRLPVPLPEGQAITHMEMKQNTNPDQFLGEPIEEQQQEEAQEEEQQPQQQLPVTDSVPPPREEQFSPNDGPDFGPPRLHTVLKGPAPMEDNIPQESNPLTPFLRRFPPPPPPKFAREGRSGIVREINPEAELVNPAESRAHHMVMVN